VGKLIFRGFCGKAGDFNYEREGNIFLFQLKVTENVSSRSHGKPIASFSAGIPPVGKIGRGKRS
jgi:hypothetical protein